MTNTDSFLFQLKDTKSDVYLDMRDNMHLFDFSSYPKDHLLYSEENKILLGKWKDATNGKPIGRFCGLRSKLYAYEVNNGQVIKKAKGVAKPTIVKKLYFDLYKKSFVRKRGAYRIYEFDTEPFSSIVCRDST